ncbi:MAG: dihydrolipoamide acetyltransferase family protein [Ilumatobacter sp.]|uniref:dihydrolipoamide acetyltransferase family protein n=1 Tax=Ilumatobacter sp. TaxID=1967498 RepID=UPI0032990E99
MATEFLMPKLGLTMEEGTITEWLVADGDEVRAGAAVLVIETDKTETEVEAAGTGRISIGAEVGSTLACGERIGWILDDGEAAPSGSTTAGTEAAPTAPGPGSTAAAPASSSTAAPAAVIAVAATLPGGRIIASPFAKRLAAERGIDLSTVAGTGPGGRITSEDLDGITPSTADTATHSVAPAPSLGHVPATAAARQLADLLGVDVANVAIEPSDGRVTRETVAQHVRTMLDDRTAATPTASPRPAVPAAAASSSATSLPPALQTPTSVTPMRGMRGTIAKRMHESLQSMAQLTLHMDADLDAVVADRDRRKAAGSAPGYTDYVIAAAARALQTHPYVNSQITDDGLALLPEVHVGLAVALDDGLIVPVIRDTLGRDLADLGAETSRLATAARDGALALPDLEGGTFSVSTLGMYGVDGFTPVINPPNTAILGVGRLRDDIVLDADGNVGTVKRMTLSLTWDHRAFDGAPAAEFCRTICTLLGDPAALDATGSTS